MSTLRPASQAGPMHNPREGTSVVCSCCATKGGIGSGETLCHDIYPAWPITTVSPAPKCMTDGHSSSAPRTVGPRVQFSIACEQSH